MFTDICIWKCPTNCIVIREYLLLVFTEETSLAVQAPQMLKNMEIRNLCDDKGTTS